MSRTRKSIDANPRRNRAKLDTIARKAERAAKWSTR